MVALGRGTTSVDAVPLAAAPRAVTALPQSLVALRDLAGARYLLVVDESGDRVRGEFGGPPDAELAVLAWARRLADVSAERGRALEDVVLTTPSAHHLVRVVPVQDGAEDVWVALRIDRAQGNLALARRALAAAAAGHRSRVLSAGPASVPASSGPITGSFPAPMPLTGATGSFPAAMPVASGAASPGTPPPRAAEPELPRRTPRSATDLPALALLPPNLPARRPVAAPGDVAPRLGGAVDAPGDVDGPFLSVEVAPPAAPVDVAPRVGGAVDASGDMDGPLLSAEAAPDEAEADLGDARRRPLTVRQARTWRTTPEVPPARESDEHAAPAPVIPGPRVGSLFAPVVVVPPPPSPVDDDTTEVPAPVPYPIITAPPLEPVVTTAVTVPEPAPEEEPAADDVGLPRRVPGAHLRSPTPAPGPAPAAALSAVVVPGWNTEQSVLRRLLLGLRRLT